MRQGGGVSGRDSRNGRGRGSGRGDSGGGISTAQHHIVFEAEELKPEAEAEVEASRVERGVARSIEGRGAVSGGDGGGGGEMHRKELQYISHTPSGLTLADIEDVVCDSRVRWSSPRAHTQGISVWVRCAHVLRCIQTQGNTRGTTVCKHSFLPFERGGEGGETRSWH